MATEIRYETEPHGDLCVQAEGYITTGGDERPFYFHARRGVWSIYVGKVGEKSDDLLLLAANARGEYEGDTMTAAEVKATVHAYVTRWSS